MKARWLVRLLISVGVVFSGAGLFVPQAEADPAVPEPGGYRLDAYRAPVPDTVKGGAVLHTEALQALLDKGGVLPIDVLPAPRRPEGMRADAPWMPLPRRDLPGSLWFPEVGRGVLNPALEDYFRNGLARVTGGDKTRMLVFYCLKDCWMSWNATRRAADYGYAHVFWYPDGTDGWQAAGLPLEEAHPEPMP